MEQITREEMIGLLRANRATVKDYQNRLFDAHVTPGGYVEPGEISRELDGYQKQIEQIDSAISALQAAEPVAWIGEEELDGLAMHRRNDFPAGAMVLAIKAGSAKFPLFTLPWPPATELAPESWREELETIAEILEADGDEWNCAARIRKMLKTSPAEAQVPEGYRAVPATPTPDMTMQGALAGVSHANGEFSQKGAEAVYKAMLTASPDPDHSGDGNEMVEVPFHKLALGTRFRYTSIPESEYVKISATQVARWQDDMAIAGWAGQGVYSFDENDDTNTTVLVAAPTALRQQEEVER